MSYTVPHQRKITINKEKTNKKNYYAAINLLALENACNRLQSKAGFKLWIYLAKNQNKYKFSLSSSHFCCWSGCARTAYRSAFNELMEHHFLIEDGKENYVFFEYPECHKAENHDLVNIKIPAKTVEEIRKAGIELNTCMV